MKTFPKLLSKKILTVSFTSLALLGLVAWSPPTGEDVSVNSGNVKVRNGVIDVRTSSTSPAAENTNGTAPAVVIGTGNNMVRDGSSAELGRGVVTGTSNFLSSPGAYSSIIGANNNAVACNSLIAGASNIVSFDATKLAVGITSANSTRNSVISGNANVIGYNSETLLVGGKLNKVDAYATLVVGTNNTVEGTTIQGTTESSPAYHSAAIGHSNLIKTTYGWTMGYSNNVSGSRGVAIGSGNEAIYANSTALGRFNAPMQANDVLVVGTGTANAPASRNTALRITSDGGVILGRAQGDVSMGIYGN